MNILYIAYSCMPNKGSEEKIGWNIPLESAKYNDVHVLTKMEHKKAIESYLQEHPTENLHFHYVDIPGIYKKLFKGVAYSIRLNIWHRRAFPVAQKICREAGIDLIHQITPIEFRSIGNYGKIPNTRFVCGPLGGGEFLPKGLRSYAGKNMLVEHLRSGLNSWYRLCYRLTGKLKNCDYLLFANRETQAYLSNLANGIPQELYFDNGISQSEFDAYLPRTTTAAAPILLVAGRIAYRKGHRLLLDALAGLAPELDYRCRIVGTGPEMAPVQARCRELGLEDKVTFTGRIPFGDMATEYQNAHVFIMPSIRETTGAVLLESMSKGLSVITIDRFGGAVLLDNTTGWLYGGNRREDYVLALRAAIAESLDAPHAAAQKGETARAQSRLHIWPEKATHYQKIYEKLFR